jgi:seryl-tRNA synthetase
VGSGSEHKDNRIVEIDKKIDKAYKHLKNLKYQRKRILKKIELEDKEEGIEKFKRTWRNPKKTIKKGS